MRTTLLASIALTVLALAAPARAQEVTRMPESARQSVGIETGLDAAFIARATYAHRLELGPLEDARLYGRVTLPFVAPDLGDWAVDGGLRATPLSLGDFRLTLLVGPITRRSSNELYSSFAAGASVTMLLGYEGSRWGISAEAGYEQLLATYLRHSDLYRDIGYAYAKDGWYATTGSTAHAGLRGGVRFGAVEIGAKAGFQATGQLHQSTPPFYVTLGGATSF